MMINVTMIKGLKKDFKDVLKKAEDEIEKKFGQKTVYKQIRAISKGEAGAKINTKALVEDSAAIFSGDNKPELLMVKAVEHLKGLIDTRVTTVTLKIEEKEKINAAKIKKLKAKIKNEPTETTYKAKPNEVLFTGRLIISDGRPVKGASVVIREIGARRAGEAVSKFVARGETDPNGEFTIKIAMDKKMAEKAPAKVAVSYEDPVSGKKIARTAIRIFKKGTVSNVNSKVPKTRMKDVEGLVESEEERISSAKRELIELNKERAELSQLRFLTGKAESSARKMVAMLNRG